MIIINFLTVINFIIFNNGNFIENEFVRVETKWNLYEETKKKLIYEVSFNIINKKESEIYYTASRVKNIQNINNMNSSSSDVSNEYLVNSRTQEGSKVTTGVNQKPTISYNVLTHFFSLNNSNPKNLKFLFMGEDEKITNLISDSQETFSYSIPLNNLIDIDGSSVDKPFICKIPIDGLVIKSRIEISKRTNQKPEEFDLEFTKDEVYAGKIKLLLDKTFHSSIEDAITKYKELQKILNESI